MIALLVCAGCGDETTAPGVDRLEFEPDSLDLSQAGQATVEIRNVGPRAVGPIEVSPGPVTTAGGLEVPGLTLVADPGAIPTLNPDDAASVELSLDTSAIAQPGDYGASVAARVANEDLATLTVQFSVSAPPPPPPGTGAISITAGPLEPRQGDVVTYSAEVLDTTGAVVQNPSVLWAVEPDSAGLFLADGRFVGYVPGPARVIASSDGLADTLEATITARGLSGDFNTVGHALVEDRFTSDLWIHGAFAYTGTWSCRTTSGKELCGDRLMVWNIGDPADPTPSDEVVVDARTVNDVKVRSDGTLAVITHEFSNDALNGVTLLDLSAPGDPSVITRFTTGLESGVHNVWVEGNYVYVVLDGFGNGLRVLNISDPSDPHVVASFYAGSSFLHDVYVRDGLAFLSHWNAGLVILDVGNGIVGGSPTNPVEVSRIATAGGQTHNAWYWPDGAYVFVGEEDFGTPGVMHVVDVSDLFNPREVATFRVPGATPHNFWMDESREILYLAWYENGVRALDVSGELLGALERQGREIAFSRYGGAGGCFGGAATCTWAPQLHDGLIYVSDLNSGLWALEPTF